MCNIFLSFGVADVDYLKFLHNLQNAEHEAIPTPDTFLEEIETREKQMKGDLSASMTFISVTM